MNSELQKTMGSPSHAQSLKMTYTLGLTLYSHLQRLPKHQQTMNRSHEGEMGPAFAAFERRVAQRLGLGEHDMMFIREPLIAMAPLCLWLKPTNGLTTAQCLGQALRQTSLRLQWSERILTARNTSELSALLLQANRIERLPIDIGRMTHEFIRFHANPAMTKRSWARHFFNINNIYGFETCSV